MILEGLYFLVFFLISLLVLIYSSLEVSISSLNEVTLKRLIEERHLSKSESVEYFLEKKDIIIVTLNFIVMLLLISLALLLNSYLIKKNIIFPFGTSIAIVIAAAYFLAHLAPRALVYINPEKFFITLWPAISPIYYLFYPLSAPIASLMKRFQEKRKELLSHSDEDIVDEHFQAFLDAGQREGFFEKDEGKMIQSVVDLGDTIVREVMTPRIDMIFINTDSTLQKFKELVAHTKLSRIPVYKKNVDHIKGVAFSKDLLDYTQEELCSIKVSSIMHPAYFVPESKKLGELLTEMQKKRIQLAIVVDEYGGTSGLITIEDILEEIVGEIRDEYDKESEEISQQSDGSLIVSGKVNIEEIDDLLDLELDEGTFETIGGLIFEVLGYFPKVGESFDHKGARFQILEANDRRIFKIKVTKR